MILAHNHTDKSNIRLLDSIIKIDDLLKRAVDINLDGIAITDHECLSNHIKAIQKVAEMKQQGKMKENFKLILGNEIYLVNSLDEVCNNYQSGVTKFPHFILLAKDKIGHEQIRELSSIAWDNSFKTGQLERVPTPKQDLERIIVGNHVIGSTACLGGELAQIILESVNAPTECGKNFAKQYMHEFITWCIKVFGKENFFLELQPSLMEEQLYVNKVLVELGKEHDIKWIVTTDSHYLKLEDRPIHEAYLNSKEGDREVADFYSSTYLMAEDEILNNLLQADITPYDAEMAIENTMLLNQLVENYDLKHDVIVPRMGLPTFEVKHTFQPAYEQYPYIKQFAYSEDEQDRYFLKLVEDGFDKKLRKKGMTKDEFHTILARINVEMSELWEITKQIQNEVSAYYITTREIINIMWEEGDSLVGVARGSVTGFLCAYLMDITQLNPLKWDLPHWRHLHKERPELPDVDLDSQASRRKTILEALKRKFGEHRVLNIVTFGTEGSRSSMLTACRGLGIDNDTAQYLSDLIPFERGQNWSLTDCIKGDEDKGRKPIKEFIKEVKQYDRLLEVAMGIEGLTNKRSIHASGVYIFKDHYLKQNARMKAPNGQYVTAFDMGDSDYMGGLKVDLLTIEALDKERTCMDMLIKDGFMDWQGSLRATYNKYLHPDVLDYDTPEMWKMIGDNAIVDLFQFDTEVGLASAQKVKPTNMFEMAVTNSLMRLMSESGEEQPVDTYVKYKNDINIWYREMKSYGLTEDEISVLEKHLKKIYGVADTQEVVMQLSMDEHISGFSVKLANKLRKGIAKKKGKVQEEAKKEFYEAGRTRLTTDNLLNYVWNIQIKRQLGYSFSINHTTPYSCIGLQEMNLAFHYPMIYWNTACLSVNAQAYDEESEDSKSTDYGKIASAIGNMQQRGINVALPNINDADFGFKADLKNNQIIFGLKGINGIGDDCVQLIIKNRPYNSFKDFLDKNTNKLKTETEEDNIQTLKNSQIIQLIKAGCFDKLEGKDRFDIMRNFIGTICEPKTKLTMANLNMLIENGLVPDDMQVYVRMMKFKEYITKNIYQEVPSKKADAKKKYSDRLLALDNKAQEFYKEFFDNENIIDYVDGKVIISENKFKKMYDKQMEKVKEWLADIKTLEALNNKLLENMWKEKCSGNISKWEMDSLSYYYNKHELAYVDNNKYNIVDFKQQPEEPRIIGTYTSRGKERYKFDIVRIGGTVLDKDKHKHMITLLTTSGVVTVKFYGGAFANYDKQISREKSDGKKEILESSWFSRGNKLLIVGYRRGNQFRPYKYADSIYSHTVALINNINEDGSIEIQTERLGQESHE